jgi:primary-amine oxidase
VPKIIAIVCFTLALNCTNLHATGVSNDQTVENKHKFHPLDPLSSSEIHRAVETLKRSKRISENTRFGLIELNEPSKQAIKKNNNSATRHAYVLMYDWEKSAAYEAVVDIQREKVSSWQQLQSDQPSNTYLIVERIEEIVFKDPRWNKAMSARNITHNEAITLWPDLLPYQRLIKVNGQFIISAIPLNNNPHSADARFLNIDIQVNLTVGTVVKFVDEGVKEKTTSKADSFIPVKSRTSDGKELYQAGRDFEIKGTHLSWGNWRFHFSVNPRRGLEIYDVKYIDQGKARSILYRASLSEIVTPYGDPDWYSWFPSDEGDLNFANYALVPATESEVLPDSVFGSAFIHDSRGNTRTIERAVTIYEKYAGLLWRHYRQGYRAKNLVISSRFMVDNYDYVTSWVFKQNGSIEAQVTLTGMINYGINDKQRTNPEKMGNDRSISNTLVAPGVFGPVHQHYFNYRLDFDIDGSHNTVAEVNYAMLPRNPENASEQWFGSTATVFNNEKQAIRLINPNSSRKWKIYNANKNNRLGQNPAYLITPKDNTFPLPGRNSEVRKKAGFINNHFWVTPYSQLEMYAAGKYLGAGYSGQGLPMWTQANRDIKNKDIVVWYTMGTTHMPRPEDWPVMPAKTISFEIMPFGFFSENPTLR